MSLILLQMVHAHVGKAGQENYDDAAKPQVEHDRQWGDVAVPVMIT